ncbi:hypothetical protein A3A46_02780 [Candidatus Roizmanbacteria bacterium RIFCSPLOWO2_01_FULL_37_13]|uniref:Uncharacterized protein n=1 Tax=Candidatus Roizmanbacteria bacterium RIFCSPHIGHO2_02_FULL_38_11 TaxID=1802039 RepID=A0A1F7H487_9BACT|nr:MAG: hypothetical protein A3C25_00140 [Candidatus Roizmanbacteria bacterium RIFCSPHIGHO2_02_FULL_38_11]OGK43050.1 MAG: hypothetical protein A3A46_02780 [Candidatus Roizmanbacteria bacterium RIFCSPLOWO2_01_FULL_37_13]
MLEARVNEPDKQIALAMRRQRQYYAEMGWIFCNARLPSDFDSSTGMGPEAFGWLKMPDGLFYLLKCPIDGEGSVSHHDRDRGHKAEAIRVAKSTI